jgi:hypothetical protein
MLISLPTNQPPVSRATFQVRPQSSRSILVLASKPMDVAPLQSRIDMAVSEIDPPNRWLTPIDGGVRPRYESTRL